MSLLQVIVLAVVQGITEFLPISSTAHLILVPWLFGWEDQGLTFDVALHAGTLFAVLLYFGREWTLMLRDFLLKEMWADRLQVMRDNLRAMVDTVNASRYWNLAGVPRLPHPALPSEPKMSQNTRLFYILMLATIPGGLAGFFLEKYAESAFRNPLLIAGQLALISVVMWAADRRKNLDRTVSHIRLPDGLLIGLAQAVAIIPGTSRAGITISTGLFRGLTREAAARFSFLLATPIIAGATLKKAIDVAAAGFPPGATPRDYLVGFVVSAVVGYAAIAFLMRYLQEKTLRIFVAYRLLLGAIIIALVVIRRSG